MPFHQKRTKVADDNKRERAHFMEKCQSFSLSFSFAGFVRVHNSAFCRRLSNTIATKRGFGLCNTPVTACPSYGSLGPPLHCLAVHFDHLSLNWSLLNLVYLEIINSLTVLLQHSSHATSPVDSPGLDSLK